MREKGMDTKSVPAARSNDLIYSGYGDRDRSWCSLFEEMISPSLEKYGLRLWHRGMLEPGDSVDRIGDIRGQATIALLWVSSDYLSNQMEELRALVHAAEKGRLTLLWVLVSAAIFEDTPLEKLEPLHNVAYPLDTLPSQVAAQAMKYIVDQIKVVTRGGRLGVDRANATVHTSDSGAAEMTDSEIWGRQEWPIYQAAFLWNGIAPPPLPVHWQIMSPRVGATKTMLHAAVDSGILAAREIRYSDGYTRFVSRKALERLAMDRGERPAFLFGTGDEVLPAPRDS